MLRQKLTAARIKGIGHCPTPASLLTQTSLFDVCAKCARLATVAARIGSTAEPATAGEELCDELRRLERKRNAGKPGF